MMTTSATRAMSITLHTLIDKERVRQRRYERLARAAFAAAAVLGIAGLLLLIF